jgi:hypothetical protein
MRIPKPILDGAVNQVLDNYVPIIRKQGFRVEVGTSYTENSACLDMVVVWLHVASLEDPIGKRIGASIPKSVAQGGYNIPVRTHYIPNFRL